MYNWFNDIILGLKELEKTIGKTQLNCKLFLSVLEEWKPPMVTTIEEAKYLASMNMDVLFSCLITHEHTLKMYEMEINKKKKKDLAHKDPHARRG